MAIGKELGLNTRVGTYMFPPVRRDAEETDSRFTPQESARMYLRRAVAQWGHEVCKQQFCHFLECSDSLTEEDWGTDQQEYMKCRAGRCSFWISWDGTMSACGLMDYPKTYEAFQGELLEKWKDLTTLVRSTTVLEGCKGCTLRELCKPCAATVYAETGSTNGKAPYLCELAQCIKEEITDYLEEDK